MIKKLSIFVIAVMCSVLLLSSCGEGYKTLSNATFGPVRTEFNDLQIPSKPSFNNVNVPDDFELVIEAENASLSGKAMVVSNPSFSEGMGVTGVNDADSLLTFEISIEHEGFYNVTLVSLSNDIGRTNHLLVDGKSCGDLVCGVAGKPEDVTVGYVFLEKGDHTISVKSGWGWIDYDLLKLTACNFEPSEIYNITASLSNPNADDNTKRLYNFLCDIYGNYTLTGQTCDEGRNDGPEYIAIKDITGKEFAVLSMDMMNYASTATAHGSKGISIECAYDWYVNAGGIVALHWHWHSPEGYIPEGANWYSSFNTSSSLINIDKAMNGEDDKLLNLLIKDIDIVSEEIAKLRDCGVPIIWRPLHEASGGWFWWGSGSPESYIKLYRLMYDRMTNYHGLTNIIWMWNAQGDDWYPGDDVVDIISIDIYAGEHEYSSQAPSFVNCSKASNERKLVALSENGCIPDPELMQRDNARWLYWAVWGDDYCIKWGEPIYNDQFTDREMIKSAYNSQYTLTLDELPDLKNYRLDR